MPTQIVSDAGLIRRDTAELDALEGQPLTDAGLTTACRLIMRYEFSGEHHVLCERAVALIKGWGLERKAAFRQARRLWQSGYRPGLSDEPVGSGADA